jgi:hypothetical protein
MPAGTTVAPPPHPTPLIWLAASLITLEAGAALAVVTGMLLSGLPAVNCGAGFFWSAIGILFLWSLAWPAAGVLLLVGVKLLALRGWALFLALGLEGGLLLAAFELSAVPLSLRVIVAAVAILTIALLAASMMRFREGPPPTPQQVYQVEHFAAVAATSEAILVERPQRRYGYRRSGDGAGGLGCAILLVGLWEALGIALLRNRQVRTIMLAAVGFGALGNLALGGGAPPAVSDGLPDRVTQVDMLVHPETRLYYADAELISSSIVADGCSNDGTATTHVTSHATFPVLYKWYRDWLVEHHWTADVYSTQSLDSVVPGEVFSFNRGKREHFTLGVDEPPATGAVPGTAYFEVVYQINGG